MPDNLPNFFRLNQIFCISNYKNFVYRVGKTNVSVFVFVCVCAGVYLFWGEKGGDNSFGPHIIKKNTGQQGLQLQIKKNNK